MKRILALTMCFALALPMVADAKEKDKEEKKARKALEKAEKAERKAERREDRGRFQDLRRERRPDIEREVVRRPEVQPELRAEVQPVIAPTAREEIQPRRQIERRSVERRGPRNHAWSYDEAQRYQHRQRRDRSWWRSNYSRFALFGGGYYYWDRGYWYPAYGYDPAYSRYTYDEPIYGYNQMEPRQVMVRVQRELRREGYYRGAIDGLIGPMTRSALARFQRDAGLRVTRRIDGPTLAALGVV